MVPASLPKTSGLRLLSYCNQTYTSGIPFRPLLSIYSSLNENTKQKRNPKNTPSLSISSWVAPKTSRMFCTPTNLATDPSGPPTDDGTVDILKIKDLANTLDIRVGKILKAWRHEEADSLYVEEVDIGEPEPRTICSGLVKYIPLDHLQDKMVVVLANLKARNMRGVKSSGMLMAASDGAHENVELLEPPAGSDPGARIWFGSEEEEEGLPEPATPNQVLKKKIWETVQPHLSTDISRVAVLGGAFRMLSSAGSVESKSLGNAKIS